MSLGSESNPYFFIKEYPFEGKLADVVERGRRDKISEAIAKTWTVSSPNRLL